MADRTKIEWCDASWSPITGCGPADYSEGCTRCYARRMANRLRGRYGYPENDPFRVTVHSDKMGQPLSWAKPRRVFVCSMGDLFHDDVKERWLKETVEIFQACQEHTFMVLTKRPKNFVRLPLRESWWPLPNVWLGVTAENQDRADERIPILLDTPAAVRFVSVEPMLGPVNLRQHLYPKLIDDETYTRGFRSEPRLDWVICGGETGSGGRFMNPDWARALRDQCLESSVPFFFKKYGDYNRHAQGLQFVSDPSNTGRLLDDREWNEFPED